MDLGQLEQTAAISKDWKFNLLSFRFWRTKGRYHIGRSSSWIWCLGSGDQRLWLLNRSARVARGILNESQVRGDRSGESEREDEGKIESEMRAVVDTKEALSGRK